MKRYIAVVLILGMLLGCTGTEEPQLQNPDGEEAILDFSKAGEFPIQGRTGAFSFTIADKIYMGTGFGSNATYYGDFWEYNPNTDIWAEKAPFPLGPFIGGEVMAYKGKGYVFAGGVLNCQLNSPCDHIYYSAVHAYDPVSDTWEKVAELPNLKGMDYGTIKVEGDRAFLFLDMRTYEINLADFQYIQKSGPQAPIVFSANFRIGSKVYFVCPMDNGLGTKSVYSYDLLTDHWETLADFPGIKRYSAVGFSHDGFGYILGGKESDYSGEDRQFKEIWQFNPADKSWKEVGEYPGNAFTGQVLEVLGNDIFVGFGDTRSYITFEKDWWKWNIK